VLDAGGAEMDVVPRVGLFDARMVSHAQCERVRLGFHGLHGVAVDAQYLDAVGAGLLEFADVGDGFLRGARPSEHGVNEDARGGDLAFGALAAGVPWRGGSRCRHRGCGDAAGQPDIELVFDGCGLPPRSSWRWA